MKKTQTSENGPGFDQPAAGQTEAPEAKPKFEISTSRQFDSWLNEQNLTIALTTYQAGMLILFGLNSRGRLSIYNRHFERCMGITVQDNEIHLAMLHQIVKFVDAMGGKMNQDGFDACYVPQTITITGDLDIHDVAVGEDGRLFFINTLFSCISEVSATHSFKPVWKPPFIDRLAAEDRCHLNGMALVNGRPKYVTAVAETNIADGWREHRHDGGVVIDVESGEVVARGPVHAALPAAA